MHQRRVTGLRGLPHLLRRLSVGHHGLHMLPPHRAPARSSTCSGRPGLLGHPEQRALPRPSPVQVEQPNRRAPGAAPDDPLRRLLRPAPAVHRTWPHRHRRCRAVVDRNAVTTSPAHRRPGRHRSLRSGPHMPRARGCSGEPPSRISRFVLGDGTSRGSPSLARRRRLHDRRPHPVSSVGSAGGRRHRHQRGRCRTIRPRRLLLVPAPSRTGIPARVGSRCLRPVHWSPTGRGLHEPLGARSMIVLPIGSLDLFARDTQNEEDRVQIWHAERGICGLTDHRLGVEGDAETG